MKKIKEKLTIQNALCFYIILCPILDIVSFLYRNTFQTSLSPSTFLRPIIAMVVAFAIFINSNKKRENFFNSTCICYLWANTFMDFPNVRNRDFL